MCGEKKEVTYYMEMKINSGRPQNCDERQEKEVRTYDLLDQLGITYDRVDHEEAMTMEACEEVDRVLGTAMCKNLLLCNRQKTDFYLLAMPGDKPFKTKDLSGQLGIARLSFAPGEYMEEYLDITPGSLSVLGVMNDRDHKVRLLIDEEIMGTEYFGCHPCVNTSSLRIKTGDLLEKFFPVTRHEVTVVNLPRYEETE